MTSPIRLRRHTDGRVALLHGGEWVITSIPGYSIYPVLREDDKDCSGPDWSELLVAELPEPDGYRKPTNDDPFWALSFASQQLTAYSDEVSVMYSEGVDVAYARYRSDEALDNLRADGLRILAAVAACEQYRANQKPEGAQ